MSDNRAAWSAGPAAMMAVEWSSGGAWELRLAPEWARLSRRGTSFAPGETDLRVCGASFIAVRKRTEHAFQPYVLIGAGVFRLQRMDEPPSPYGNTGAAQVGFGVDGPVRFRIHPFMEARGVVHLTDYGSTRDFLPMITILPLTLGARVRWQSVSSSEATDRGT